MKGKKAIFLFLALLLPVIVFLFLKFFGKNEFTVKPLFQDAPPEVQVGCSPVQIPYHIPDSIIQQLNVGNDSLMLIWFGELNTEALAQLRRVSSASQKDPLHQHMVSGQDQNYQEWRKCIFLLKEPYDVVLVDKRGLIRGHYVSDNREEIDRLMTELDIIFKKY